MTDNPIVEEVRRARDEVFAEHGGNIEQLMKELQRRTEAAKAAGRTVVTLPPRRPPTTKEKRLPTP
jgi:phage replication-related protein YjqB (UPF0714/DUF867 family)